MREFYEDVKCDYNNDEGYWCVDAWRPEDEEGKVIAVIHEVTGDVYYIEPEARISPKAQEVINEVAKKTKDLKEFNKKAENFFREYEKKAIIEQLLEQFNNEHLYGDSFELATFMFEKGFEYERK